jgi:hypothetical protein
MTGMHEDPAITEQRKSRYPDLLGFWFDTADDSSDSTIGSVVNILYIGI